MDYIYAKLNEKLAQQQSNNYIPTDIEGSETIIANKLSNSEYRLDVNTRNLIRLEVVKGDVDPSDDVIQRLRLLGYNNKTNTFDIPLGDDIIINHSNESSGDISTITHAMIAGQQIPASIDKQGQLVLQYIPSIAISDKIRVEDSFGNVTYEQVESIIDCND